MAPYYYYNTLNNKVSTTGTINFCLKDGAMSFCKAASITDQHGCKYREDATRVDRCMYYREDFDGACDCLWAQKNIDKPKPEGEVDDEAEQAITGTEIIPT